MHRNNFKLMKLDEDRWNIANCSCMVFSLFCFKLFCPNVPTSRRQNELIKTNWQLKFLYT